MSKLFTGKMATKPKKVTRPKQNSGSDPLFIPNELAFVATVPQEKTANGARDRMELGFPTLRSVSSKSPTLVFLVPKTICHMLIWTFPGSTKGPLPSRFPNMGGLGFCTVLQSGEGISCGQVEVAKQTRRVEGKVTFRTAK